MFIDHQIQILTHFWKKCPLYCTNVTGEKRRLTFLGDFNLDLLKHDTHDATNQFIEIMYNNSLLPVINRPTRVTCNTATLIYNIFTNNINNDHSISGIYPTDISDHFSVVHCIPLDIQSEEPNIS